MGGSAELAAARAAMRDEVATRIATLCQKGSMKVIATGNQYGANVFVVEDMAGTQYTVTVARRRQQE
jgi:hypothetical protein